jgi:hypothetical protein
MSDQTEEPQEPQREPQREPDTAEPVPEPIFPPNMYMTEGSSSEEPEEE